MFSLKEILLTIIISTFCSVLASFIYPDIKNISIFDIPISTIFMGVPIIIIIVAIITMIISKLYLKNKKNNKIIDLTQDVQNNQFHLTDIQKKIILQINKEYNESKNYYQYENSEYNEIIKMIHLDYLIKDAFIDLSTLTSKTFRLNLNKFPFTKKFYNNNKLLIENNLKQNTITNEGHK